MHEPRESHYAVANRHSDVTRSDFPVKVELLQHVVSDVTVRAHGFYVSKACGIGSLSGSRSVMICRTPSASMIWKVMSPSGSSST